MKIDIVIGTIMHKQIQLNMLHTTAYKYTVLMVPKQKLFEQLNNKPIKEVYYPIQRDIIEQQILCGVQLVQFDMQHKKNTSTTLKTIVKDSGIYKSTEFITDCTMLQSYSNRVRSIIQKCNVGDDITSITFSNRKHGEYSLYIDKRIRGVKSIADGKQSCVIGEQLIINNQDKQAKKDVVDKASQIEMFSGCKRNCESLQSYISTKLVRFLLYLGVTKYSISQETWRYVKCPKDLEHIYTDRELYDYYHLTLDEIRIIEDTILDMSDIRHRSELSYDKILERTFKILDTWCEDVENLVFVLEELVLRITEYKEENNSDIDRTIAYHSLVDVMRRINNLNPLRKVEKYSEKLHGKHNSSLDVTTREILELLRTYESERVLNGDVTLITEEDVDTLIHEAKCVIELYYKILFRDI